MLYRSSILTLSLASFIACQSKQDTPPPPPTGDAAAQAQQVVQEAATGVVQRYEYIPAQNLVKAYWDPANTWGNQELLSKHINTAIQFASRIFNRDSTIQTIDFITSIPKDSNSTERVKALEDVIDRGKFRSIHWKDLSQKPVVAPYMRTVTTHWVLPSIQSDIETKPIDRDILFQQFDTITP